MEDLEISRYRFIKMHDGCEYKGKLMSCSLHKIDGNYYPKGEKVAEWVWCNGRRWNGKKEVWEFCGFSTKNEKGSLSI